MSTVSMSVAGADEEPAAAEPPADAGADAAVTSSADVDPSCSVASLRQYYDECAEFYDHADEGEEDTYICVDRVTASLLAALQRLDEDADADGAGAHHLPTLSPSAHSVRSITDGTLDSPVPLPCIGALALLGEDDTEEEEGAHLMMLPLHSPTPDAPTAEGSPSLEAAAAAIEAEASTSLASDATDSPRSAASPSPSPVPSLRSSSSAWPSLSVNVSAKV